MRSEPGQARRKRVNKAVRSPCPGRENKWWLRSATFHSLQFFQIACGDLKELEGDGLDGVGSHHLSLRRDKPEAEAKLVKSAACRGFKPDGLFRRMPTNSHDSGGRNLFKMTSAAKLNVSINPASAIAPSGLGFSFHSQSHGFHHGLYAIAPIRATP